MSESGSRDGAIRELERVIGRKAKKQCESEGYSDYIHPDYQDRKVELKVKDCKDYKRMGTTFYLCEGSGEFACVRSSYD